MEQLEEDKEGLQEEMQGALNAIAEVLEAWQMHHDSSLRSSRVSSWHVKQLGE